MYENRKEIFAGSTEDREQIAALMRATFPTDIYNNVFGKLAASTTNTEARAVWRESQSILPGSAQAHPAQVSPPTADSPLKQESLVPKVRAERIPNAKSYKFLLWLDLTDAQKDNIAKVEYTFDHPSFRNKVLMSIDSASGFQVSYVGWGAIDSIHITATTRDGRVEKADLDMITALGW